MIVKCAFDPNENFAKKRSGVRIGITTRITEVPELIMLPYRWVITEGVDHWRPARSCFLQAVNENNRRPRRVQSSRLSQSDSRRARGRRVSLPTRFHQVSSQ